MSRALLAYALGAMGRRAGRNVAIVIGLAVVVWAFATVLFASEGLRETSQRYAREAPSLTVQRTRAGRPALLSLADAERMRTIPGVRSADARAWGYFYLAALEANVTIVSTPDVSALGGGTSELVGEQALFGSDVARALGLRAGDRVAVAAPAAAPGEMATPIFLEVRGVLDAETSLLAGDMVLVNLPTAQRIFGLAEDEIVDVVLDVFPPEESGVVAAAVVDGLPGARVVDRETLGRSFELTFDARAGLLSATLLPALLALLLLAWERLTGLSDEERREIGVLKAVGWTTSNVLSARLTEAALVALAGCALGLGLAYVHAFVLGAPLLVPALFGWSNLRPALVITPATDPRELVMLLAAVVVPFAGISIVPAWRAANVDPDRLLR